MSDRAMHSGGYELIDSGDQEKLERFGDYLLVRPAAQALWRRQDPAAWRDADAIFARESTGTGTWRYARAKLPPEWELAHAGLKWRIHHNEHGNTGIFPEQEDCWNWIRARSSPEIEVLNLFAYTGGSTFAAALGGAKVCHVDASPASVKQARANAELSGIADKPVRWLIEDAGRFVEREIRRGRKYHGIILDPPTYGRGNKGEVWKIEEHLNPLLDGCAKLLDPSAAFVLLTCHTPGFTPLVLANLLAPIASAVAGERAAIDSGEMLIVDRAARPLPSGAFARWGRKSK